MGTLSVVVGGQYGSEGKGAICAHLSKRALGRQQLLAVRVAGPNAGHTVYDTAGNRYAFRHVPVAAVVNPEAKLALAPGTELDLAVLQLEIAMAERNGHQVRDRIFVDGEATMIDEEHRNREGNLLFGTTGKGIGAARADRAMRQADLACGVLDESDRLAVDDVAEMQRMWLAHRGDVLIEGTQGYGLGLHAGRYPHCTSSDCRAIDFMAMAGVSPWDDAVNELAVWVVLRTYPIRIAGNSGPMRGELGWDELRRRSGGYIEPEFTTVTHKMRRVGEWDTELAKAALEANGGAGSVNVKVAITFLDYLFPEIAGAEVQRQLSDQAMEWVKRCEDELRCVVSLVGTGPDTVVEL